MLFFYILIFLFSFFLLYFASNWLVKSLAEIARFLHWREFVVAFLMMAFVGALPNLFVGVFSALDKIPQLSFGEVVGGNVVDLTLAVALATLIAKGLPAKSQVIQKSAIFTLFVAILPLLLILDGKLGRGDGILLLICFVFYLFWLFSRKERFTKIYEQENLPIINKFRTFIKNLGKAILGMVILLMAAKGIVDSACWFSQRLEVSPALIGILVVGIGNALPELYFAVSSARAGQNWMILGDLMGSIVAPSTLVLGIVSLIYPIKISDFSLFAIGRFFLIISALFFFIFVRTDKKITKREALFLLGIYILFVICEIFDKI